MKLSPELEGKSVILVDADGTRFEGVVSDYIFPEDNEPEGEACIILEGCQGHSGEAIAFNESEIRALSVAD